VGAKEFRLDGAESACAYACELSRRGACFEFFVDYKRQKIAVIERAEAAGSGKLTVSFGNGTVRLRVNGKLQDADAKAIFAAAVISKPMLFHVLERFMHRPLLVEVVVW